MGILETMVDSFSGSHGATTPLLAKAMQGLIGDRHSPGPGLPWLLQRLDQAGFGRNVQTWLGAGANLPISPHDLHAALGDEAVNDIARRAGIPSGELIAKLSEHLPGIIDRLSPHGALTDAFQ